MRCRDRSVSADLPMVPRGPWTAVRLSRLGHRWGGQAHGASGAVWLNECLSFSQVGSKKNKSRKTLVIRDPGQRARWVLGKGMRFPGVGWQEGRYGGSVLGILCVFTSAFRMSMLIRADGPASSSPFPASETDI